MVSGADEHRGQPVSGAAARSAWPKHAVPMSIVVALVGLIMVLVGLGQAGDRSSTVQAATLVSGLVATGFWCALLLWYAGRWAAGAVTSRTRVVVLVVSVVVGGAALVAARTEDAAPIGLAALGGAVLGCMIGNIVAVRRFTR